MERTKDPSQGARELAGSPCRPPSEARDAMRRITVAWMFGAAWLYITTIGSIQTKYAQLMGMPKFGFGVLAALPFLGALVQLPTSYFLARYGHRKRLLIAAGIANRALWVAIAAIPWVLPNAAWWPGLLVLIALSSLCHHVMAPACMAWFADVIPDRIRARYLPRRDQIGRVVGLVATLIAGYFLSEAQLAGDTTLLPAVSIALALAGVLGVMDFVWLVPVPDRKHRPDRTMSWSRLLKGPLADRDFKLFLGFTATQMLGLGFVGQFVKLYLIDVIELSILRVDLMMVVCPLALAVVFIRPWGALMHRVGCKPTMLISGVLIIHGAAAWILVTPDNWWLGYSMVLFATAAWPGMEIANFNLLLGMARSKAGQGDGSAYVAVHALVFAVAGALSGLFGGTLAALMGEWRGTIFGHPLTYHGVLFIISGGLRMASLLWLIGMHEPRAHATGAAIQFMAGSVYANALRMLRGPARLLIALRRAAKNLPRRRDRDRYED